MDSGLASYQELIALFSDGCSHVRGGSNVQCCLIAKASGSTQQAPAPVPIIEFGQPLPDKSSLPTDNEQAAQGLVGPTKFELAAFPPELSQFLLPDADLLPDGGVDYNYGWR